MQLHDYQLVARDFLRKQDRAALLLDMGLGKSACTLAALEPRHLPVLVVAPKRVAEHVWPTETALWRPDLTCRVAAGSAKVRAQVLADEDADIIAIGRDNLRDALAVRRARPWRTLVVDELSGFRQKSSVRWKTANRLIRTLGIPTVWGLTGTPAPNGYLGLWAQVALLDGGDRLGANLTTYRSRYFTPGRQLPSGVVIEWLLRDGAAEKIKALISDLALAMATDGRIELPELTYNDITVELPPAARKAYAEFEKNLVVDLADVFGGETHSAANAAVLTARLSQMAAGFVYVDDADLHEYAFTRLHAAKLDALKEIAEATEGTPLLIFYRFTAERRMIAEAFPDAVTVDSPDWLARWNRGEVPMLLAHPASAGHGLNLQHGGHTIVWFSPTWDLELYLQANKRLFRQGQQHPVVVHHVLAERTVDQLVRKRLAEKDDVQEDLLAYLEAPAV